MEHSYLHDSLSGAYCNPNEVSVNTVAGSSEAQGREEHPWTSSDGKELSFDSNRDLSCKRVTTISVPVEELNAGIYFLSYGNGGRKIEKEIVVTR